MDNNEDNNEDNKIIGSVSRKIKYLEPVFLTILGMSIYYLFDGRVVSDAHLIFKWFYFLTGLIGTIVVQVLKYREKKK